MELTAATNQSVATLREDTRNLSLLPEIKKRVEEQGQALIDTIGQFAKNLFRLLLVFSAGFIIVVLVLLLRDSDKDFHASGDGVHITGPRPTGGAGR